MKTPSLAMWLGLVATWILTARSTADVITIEVPIERESHFFSPASTDPSVGRSVSLLRGRVVSPFTGADLSTLGETTVEFKTTWADGFYAEFPHAGTLALNFVRSITRIHPDPFFDLNAEIVFEGLTVNGSQPVQTDASVLIGDKPGPGYSAVGVLSVEAGTILAFDSIAIRTTLPADYAHFIGDAGATVDFDANINLAPRAMPILTMLPEPASVAMQTLLLGLLLSRRPGMRKPVSSSR